MNSRLIAVSPDNELDYHRQFAELDSLYRNSPNGVAVLDHLNLYVRVNDALADLHDVSPIPGLRVIFTSGYSRDRDERTANLSQASYLQKPYSPQGWEDWYAIF